VTPPLTVLIADDEPLGRRRMELALQAVSGAVLVGQAHDGASAKALIETLSPDIVLLDIQMPGLSGLEVCAALGGDPKPRAFVFITAHEQFARDAFDVAAVDYLLKPFSVARFQQALGRAAQYCERASAATGGPSDPRRTARLKDIWVSDRAGRRRVPLGAIDWIAAERDFSRLHVGAQTFLCSERLGQLTDQLAGLGFLRVHRSAIVRLDAVERVLRLANGQLQLATGAAALTPVGRRYAPRVRSALSGRQD
jgi:two-component system, LytTR family, response regulator AlgR